MFLCVVAVFQADFNMLHGFPTHNSANLVMTVKKSLGLGKHVDQ